MPASRPPAEHGPDPAPEENWDDDFEFGARRTVPRRPSPAAAAAARMQRSVGSRAETEDWDADTSGMRGGRDRDSRDIRDALDDDDDADDDDDDVEDEDDASEHAIRTRASTVHLTTSSATLRDVRPRPASLLPPPPSLPLALRDHHHHHHQPETENWDDDFEDARNSPQKAPPVPSASSSILAGALRPLALAPFASAVSSSSTNHHHHHPIHNRRNEEDESGAAWSDDDDDSSGDEAEFGTRVKREEHDEEDRTVTARSRRAAASSSAASGHRASSQLPAPGALSQLLAEGAAPKRVTLSQAPQPLTPPPPPPPPRVPRHLALGLGLGLGLGMGAGGGGAVFVAPHDAARTMSAPRDAHAAHEERERDAHAGSAGPAGPEQHAHESDEPRAPYIPPHAPRTPPPPPSPSSSAFSVPGTVRTTHSRAPLMGPSFPPSPGFPSSSAQYTAYDGSNSNTFPSTSTSKSIPPSSAISRAAAGSARVFALLPPSPQVHREREVRRRLRKRSRPGDERQRAREREGVFELVDVRAAGARVMGRAQAMGGRYGPGGEDYGRGGGDYGYGSGAEGGYGYAEGRRSIDSERAFSEEEEDAAAAAEEEEEEEERIREKEGEGEGETPRRGGAGGRPSTAPGGAVHADLGARSPLSVQDAQTRQGAAPQQRQTLLGRIGSMKRWVGAGGGGSTRAQAQLGVGVRGRARGMSAGAEGGGYDARHSWRPFSREGQGNEGEKRAPRPASSLSSFGTHDSAGSPAHAHGTYPYPYGYPRVNQHPDHAREASPVGSGGETPTSTREGGSGGGGGGGWFFRASTAGSPRRALAVSREASGSTSTSAHGAGNESPAPPSPASPASSAAPAAAHARTPRKLSRSTSRTRARGPRGGAEHSQAGGAVGVRRAPSARAGGARASFDFSASRTNLAMSMEMLESGAGAWPHPASGAGRGALGGSVGGAGDGAGAGGTPRVGKRRSLGFAQLGRSVGPDGSAKEAEEPGRAGRYGALGLGRAFGIGGRDGVREKEKEKEGGVEGEQGARVRRGSFSRLLRDRAGEAPSTPGGAEREKEKEGGKDAGKEKEGARGFMGSVRRISLGGRHKRTKSGGGLAVAVSPAPGARAASPAAAHHPPSPSSPFFASTRRASGASSTARYAVVPPLPYALPPLPGSASASQSQISLRLASGSVGHLPLASTPTVAGGVGALGLGLGMGMGRARRVVSTASSQSQGSSVAPASSSGASVATSAGSSRGASGGGPGGDGRHEAQDNAPTRTPTQPPRSALARGSSARSRRSADEARPSLGTAGRPSLDFEARIRRSVELDVLDGTPVGKSGLRRGSVNAQQPSPPPPVPLLPPIELQPPSPPQTISPAAGTHPPARLPAAAAEGDGAAGALVPGSLSPTTSSSSLFFTPTGSPQPPASPGKLAVGSHSPGRSPASQQSASLGRVAAATTAAAAAGEADGGTGSQSPVPRRNSLGDLKIPARISQAQVSIKRDLGMVREFASSVEQLKEMQALYRALVAQVQSIFEAHIQQHARAASPLPRTTTTSPSFFANLSTKARPKTRARSNTNPNPGQSSISTSASASQQDITIVQLAYKEMAALFYTINAKYRISWECADLLIELGGGAPAPSATSPPAVLGPTSSASAPFIHQAQLAAFDGAASGKKRSRERAITLAGAQTGPYTTASAALISSSGLPVAPLEPPGPPPASPPSAAWRASTGRHELSQRQLGLLREMLGSAPPPPPPPEGDSRAGVEEAAAALRVDRDWRWGDARNSTITLPAEVEEGAGGTRDRRASTERTRRTGRLGMAGIRDMLRALKRGASIPDAAGGANARRAAQSTTSLSTQSSTGSRRHRYPHPRLPTTRRTARTSSGPETVRASRELAPPPASLTPHATFVPPKPSPRRPSLASIFRIGTKHRAPSASAADRVASPLQQAEAPHEDSDARAQSSGTGEDASSASEEDWDRMDSASDLDAAAARARAVATVRGASAGRSPYLAQHAFDLPPAPLPLPVPAPPSAHGAGYSLRHALISRRSFNASASSLRAAEPVPGSPLGGASLGPRAMRLSNVEELLDEPHSPTKGAATKAGSVRSVPPQFAASASAPALRDAKLAMTPENIKPLLENAKEVLAKLNECIGEIQSLIGQHAPLSAAA